MTPFKVLYGRDPPHLIYYGAKGTYVSSVEQQLEERDRVLAELKKHLLRAQQIMKQQADGKRKDIHFEVGDQVYLKLRPYRQRTLAHRRNEKLSPRYYGPFVIQKKIGAVAYRLQLPETSQIHPVFHVSQLRRAIGDHTPSAALPPTLTDEMEVVLEPSEIMGVRRKGDKIQEVLIQWTGLPEYEATWEPYKVMIQQFPSYHLEDKVALWERGIDGLQPITKPTPLVYRRRTRPREEGSQGRTAQQEPRESPPREEEEGKKSEAWFGNP